MTTALLETMTIVGDNPDGTRHVEMHIDDAWGIVFVQGGVVMATMLHAAELVLGRADLRMVTAAATFCQPVPCGPARLDVEVLRNGRHGAQVQVGLRTDPNRAGGPNAVATVVFASEADGWPEIHGLVRPEGLGTPPSGDAPRLGTDDSGDGEPAMNFFRQTEWRISDDQPDDPMRRHAWFRFADTTDHDERADTEWTPALLAIPGDALGMAAIPPIKDTTGTLFAPSLQMSIELFAPARGTWLGIESHCFDTRGAITSGLVTLWNTDGTLVAAVTQTALLRKPPR